METIHMKTVDPVSQELLRSAALKGFDLIWERYEKLQPQDGFLRLGLSCPFGCMQGPCRIDPYGRGAERGICGLDRDGMVAAMLLRLCSNGALEALNQAPGSEDGLVPPWSEPMESFVSRALENLGGGSLSIKEIFQSAALLQCPGESTAHLIRHALRLGVLTLALMDGNGTAHMTEGTLPCKAGYGLLTGDEVLIGVCGNPSFEFLDELVKAVEASDVGVRLLSLGEWIRTESGFLPFGCTSGEAELLLSSGRINLLLCGTGTNPSIPSICRKLKLPVVLINDAPAAGEIVLLAVESHRSHPREDIFPDTLSVEEAEVIMTSEGVKAKLKNEVNKGVVFIGGTDTPQQSFGWVPIEVASVLSGEGFKVACWGDPALWIVKRGLADGKDNNPIRLLNPVRGPLDALEAIAESGTFDNIKGVCYTGLKGCRDLAAAMGLACLGIRVCIASPLPLWGSQNVRDQLAGLFSSQGGTFTHFDHPADATEVLQWFRER